MSQDRNTNRRWHKQRPGADRVTRASQTRLVILVGLFVMVLAMMQHARQPLTWQWLWRMNNPGIPVDVDPRLKPNRSTSEAVGTFVSPRDQKAEIDGAAVASSALVVDPKRLDDIRDDTYFRPTEKDTWFYLFSLLSDTSPESLEQASLGQVSALQLYRQPDSYRGKLINMRGTVRRAHRLMAPENDQGIEFYWQLWLFEQDGLTTPCVLYVLDVPSDFPDGMSVEAPISLTGFSYKRWAYQGSEGDLMVAPVVLAKDLEWHRMEPSSRPAVSTEQIAWSIALALVLSIVVIRWTLIFSGHSKRRAAKAEDENRQAPDFQFLDHRDDDNGS